jgi:hypothetical protein
MLLEIYTGSSQASSDKNRTEQKCKKHYLGIDRQPGVVLLLSFNELG